MIWTIYSKKYAIHRPKIGSNLKFFSKSMDHALSETANTRYTCRTTHYRQTHGFAMLPKSILGWFCVSFDYFFVDQIYPTQRLPFSMPFSWFWHRASVPSVIWSWDPGFLSCWYNPIMPCNGKQIIVFPPNSPYGNGEVQNYQSISLASHLATSCTRIH